MKQTNIDDFLNLEKETQKLTQINEELEKRVQEEVEKSRKKDELLFQQNKLASMGNMISNIAHQWRQPLMEVSSIFIPIEAKLKLEREVTKEELLDSISKLNDITSYMSATIDDFRNFFVQDKEKVKFRISEQINLSVNILAGSLKEHDIHLDIIIRKNPMLVGYKNECAQVLINIINNAKDILIQRKIKNPKIVILIEEEDNKAVVTIKDNAGGIKVEPISSIFEPFFTYDKINGTGIGLFMSKLIIENNMNGTLEAYNNLAGATFKILIPKYY